MEGGVGDTPAPSSKKDKVSQSVICQGGSEKRGTHGRWRHGAENEAWRAVGMMGGWGQTGLSGPAAPARFLALQDSSLTTRRPSPWELQFTRWAHGLRDCLGGIVGAVGPSLFTVWPHGCCTVALTDGIRTFSMFWVVMGHLLVFPYAKVGFSNPEDVLPPEGIMSTTAGRWQAVGLLWTIEKLGVT